MNDKDLQTIKQKQFDAIMDEFILEGLIKAAEDGTLQKQLDKIRAKNQKEKLKAEIEAELPEDVSTWSDLYYKSYEKMKVLHPKEEKYIDGYIANDLAKQLFETRKMIRKLREVMDYE